MEGAEDLGKILLTAVIQIIILTVVLTILYFAAYKPIKRYFREYFKQNGKKEEQINGKSLDKNKQVKIDYVSEANKTIHQIEDRVAQADNNMRQRTRGENEEVLESIARKAKIQIRKERDSAIDKLKREYSDFAIRVKDNNVSNKDKKDESGLPPKK